MKINGYSIKLIQKNMYRIIDENGNMVGIIERNKEASLRPGTGRWKASGTTKLTMHKGRTAQGNTLNETLMVFVERPCMTYVIVSA